MAFEPKLMRLGDRRSLTFLGNREETRINGNRHSAGRKINAPLLTNVDDAGLSIFDPYGEIGSPRRRDSRWCMDFEFRSIRLEQLAHQSPHLALHELHNCQSDILFRVVDILVDLYSAVFPDSEHAVILKQRSCARIGFGLDHILEEHLVLELDRQYLSLTKMRDCGLAQDCRIESDSFLASFRCHSKGRPKDQGECNETDQSSLNFHDDPSGLTRTHGRLALFAISGMGMNCTETCFFRAESALSPSY